MSYPFGSPGFSDGRYNASAAFDEPPVLGRNRAFLVAIHGGLFPAILHENQPLERLRVVLTPAKQAEEFDVPDLWPGTFHRALPPMPALSMARDGRLQPRPVRGEILSDQEGRMYEKIGREIRPLYKLVSSPSGEVLELIPSRKAGPQLRTPADGQPTEAFEEGQPEEQPGDSLQQEKNQHVGQTRPVDELRVEQRKLVHYRKFFSDPGQRRVVRFGDFKNVLTSQLAHPERLRDMHRLTCHLQVYEVTKAQRLESLAASALGDAGRAGQLQLMSDAVARCLGLGALLRTRPHIPASFPREAGVVLPCERVFTLQLVRDPTADEAVSHGQQPGLNPHMSERVTSAGSPCAASPAKSSVLKTGIPERFQKPWEFKISREEALCQINAAASLGSRFSSFRRWLKRWVSGRGELKKWQILLRSAKSLDEQLWSVRPPQGGLVQPPIRDWAQKTLELAGYDPRVTLLEWEIFWRRKGV